MSVNDSIRSGNTREPRAAYRWLILILAWGAFLISTVCKLAWGTMAVSVGGSIGLSIASLSIFVTASYVGSMLSSIGGGFIADRVGPRRTLFVSLLALGGTTFAFSFTKSLAVGVALQALMGLTAGADYAASVKAISTWFDVRERGRAIGLFATATSLAVVLSNSILPTAIEHIGWRETYRCLAGATVGLSVVCAFLFADRSGVNTSVRAAPPSGSAIAALLCDRNFILLSLSGLGGFWGAIGFASWANALMVREHHISLIHAGYVSAIFGIGAVTGKPLIGLIADWMRGVKRRLTIGCFILFFVALLIFGQLTTFTAFLVMAPILGIGAYIYSPLIIAQIAELRGVEAAGSTAGITNAFWQLGSALSPLAIGVVFQATHSFQSAFLALALGPLMSLICMYFVSESSVQRLPTKPCSDSDLQVDHH
jgi:sugar phosphate permease